MFEILFQICVTLLLYIKLPGKIIKVENNWLSRRFALLNIFLSDFVQFYEEISSMNYFLKMKFLLKLCFFCLHFFFFVSESSSIYSNSIVVQLTHFSSCTDEQTNVVANLVSFFRDISQMKVCAPLSRTNRIINHLFLFVAKKESSHSNHTKNIIRLVILVSGKNLVAFASY